MGKNLHCQIECDNLFKKKRYSFSTGYSHRLLKPKEAVPHSH
ncbi:hypothetical protein DBT_0480 [Dissulfuribacter thermophilus]|uniref:Uncharacterized protein n=1 Tax=Dissulfuribacter thermophilus TaxID=1156395 RepID=A0A1B9F7T7_9BACT|nr:hypothetical protein DBT_0480 [Dissulfuribacter thermophilus]